MTQELSDTAFAEANVACALPALYQLTGDERWLGERYRTARMRGYQDLDSSGLAPELEDEIRQQLAVAVRACNDGRAPAVPSPSSDEMTRLMGMATGEDVAPEIGPMVAEQIGLAPFAPDRVGDQLDADRRDFSVLVIGAGVSGLLAAIALRRAGIPFTIVEKNAEVGGTWWENRFPGSKVDVPSDLYSVSFAQRNWSERFASQAELSEYLVELADRFEVRDAIEFGVEAAAARWDEEAQSWTVDATDRHGVRRCFTASAVITAVGIHNRPHVPDFAGAERFGGAMYHSARWPEDAAIDGRRVAVVGSGATAMQVVCAIAPRADSLTVLQRTPQWIMPNGTYFARSSPAEHWLFEHVPFYRGWHRFRLYWLYTEQLYALQVRDPEWDGAPNSVSRINHAMRRLLLGHMRASLEGREDLLELTTPDYPVLGKRLLQDNGWFATLRRPNVELLKAGVAELTETGLVTTTGQERGVDTIVLCTGFTQQRFLAPLEVTGRDGQTLSDAWREDDARAYLGMTTPGFPNLFFLYGPNSNPPGGSYITVGEAQVRYVIQLLTRMVRERLGVVDCRTEPFERYNRELDAANGEMVFGAPGLSSYYRNRRGRVVTNFPWPVPRYWAMTSEPDLADFDTQPVRAPAASG